MNVGHRREMELSVEVPADELGPVASKEMWAEIYDRVAEQIRAHRTTLIFVGTRRMSERAAFALNERLGEGFVMPHHGSLAREMRFDVERRLRSGELRAVAATASLELGIDIGSVDLVVQLGSPRVDCRCTAAYRAVGPLDRREAEGHLLRNDARRAPRMRRARARDSLAASRCAQDSGRPARHTRAADRRRVRPTRVVCRIALRDVSQRLPYRELERRDFDEVVSMLADGVATSRGRSGTFLHYDRVNGRLRARRGARLAAITCGGAIPDTANYNVVVEPDGHVIGTLDEDFAIESMAGDIFLLGTNSWKIRRVEAGVVRVEDAHGAPPSIPFWNGEGLGRTIELSREVCAVRAAIDERDDAAARTWLEGECALDHAGAEQAVAYVRAGKAILGVVPTDRTIVAERFFDEGGGMQLILHTPFGARVNRAWGLALRKRFCRSFNLELQAAATDNGFVLSLTDQHAFPLDAVFEFVKSASAEPTLTQALLPGADVRSALALECGAGLGYFAIQRRPQSAAAAATHARRRPARSRLSRSSGVPREPHGTDSHSRSRFGTRNDRLTVFMKRWISMGFSTCCARWKPGACVPSRSIPRSRRRFVMKSSMPTHMHISTTLRWKSDVLERCNCGGRCATTSTEQACSTLAAIAEVAAESWPVVRDADELHDALATLIVLPPVPAWSGWFDELRCDRRASTINGFWTCAERFHLARAAYGVEPEAREEAVTEILRGWLECSGPLTVAKLAEQFRIEKDTIEAALLRLEAQGQVLRGHFTRLGSAEEWCNRRVLARIHRLTIGTLRREIEPVTTATYLTFLRRWQHVAPETRLHGIDGTLQIVRQLEGYEIPAFAWEAQILPARIAGYRPELLDRLCYAGDVMWGRLSPHPALQPSQPDQRASVRPTRLAPIALFLRANADELIVRRESDRARLSHVARDILEQLEILRAPFFAEIAGVTKRLPSEVEEALWQLVAAGLVTADGFDALRSLSDAKRRLGEKGLRARPRSSGGRWALLQAATERIDREAFARRLLARWGIVFRDVIAREGLAPRWRELLGVLRRMEARGEIRGGRFVAGFVGEQFALPEAIDALRAARRMGSNNEPIALGSYDPLNLAGVILPDAVA